jgi:hypothetical protein
MAGVTGLEPATSAVTGQRSEPVELHPRFERSLEYRRSKSETLLVGAKGLEPLTPSV